MLRHAGTFECGTCVDSGSSRWWTDCAEITPARLRCACSGAYQEGDRVVALLDGPSGASGVTAGQQGTVIAGEGGGGLELLVEWDAWSGGHDGNCSFADCGQCTDAGLSRWWTACDQIGRAP